MCFSAVASFVGSGTILSIAVVGLFCNAHPEKFAAYTSFLFKGRSLDNQWQDSTKLQWWPFLLTSVLFAIQQMCEGFVWLELAAGRSAAGPGYAFAFFAFCFWPMWIPFKCMILEYESKFNLSEKMYMMRFSMLVCLAVAGFALGIYMILSLFSGDEFSVSELDGHVRYHLHLYGESRIVWSTYVYLICVILPCLLVRRVHFVWFYGVSAGASAIVSYMLYERTFPSTWCFFAAWLSAEAVGLKVCDMYRRSTPLRATKEENDRMEHMAVRGGVLFSDNPSKSVMMGSECI